MSVSRVAARLARALGFTPSQDQVASALLGVPPAQARAELYREAAAALTACATGHDVATRADFATNERRLREPLSRDERRTYTNDAKKLHAVSPPPPPPAAVRASSVPGAGAGLFTTRHVPRGSLVALYGGVYVPPVPPVTPGADGVALIIPAARAAAEDDAAAEDAAKAPPIETPEEKKADEALKAPVAEGDLESYEAQMMGPGNAQ